MKLFQDRLSRVLFFWFLVDLAISLVIAFGGSPSVFIYLAVWFSIFFAVYKIKPRRFVLSAFLLSVLEETIVYFLGGGLGGTARSLLDDYVGSLPVFLAFVVGWYWFLKRYCVNEGTVFAMSGLHGFIIEIVFTGAVFNPLLVLLFGGSAIFIYGSIIVAPMAPSCSVKSNMKVLFTWFILILLLIILGGLVAFTLRNMLI